MGFYLNDLEQLISAGDRKFFYRDLLTAVIRGIRDLTTGCDLTLMDWIDPRICRGFGLEIAFIRALTMAWRVQQNKQALPVTVMVGTAAGELKVAELPIDQWHLTADICVSADGIPVENRYGTQIKNLRISDGSVALRQLFALPSDSDLLPANLTLAVGYSNKDPLLASLQDGSVVILMLLAPDPGLTQVVGSPSKNKWREDFYAINDLNYSHLTDYSRQMIQSPSRECWYDEEYRKLFFDAILAEENAKPIPRPVTTARFLDILAEASPLREVLTKVLCQYFPEVEQIFYCVGDELWDKSSPYERFALLLAASGRLEPA
jgi:hypothetical protein